MPYTHLKGTHKQRMEDAIGVLESINTPRNKMITIEDQKKLQVEGRSVELVQRQWDYLQRGTPLLSGIFSCNTRE